MPRTPLLLRTLLLALVSVSLAALQWWQQGGQPVAATAAWPQDGPRAQLATWTVQAKGSIPMPPGAAAAHASFLLTMPQGSAAALTAFWFAGDRESAANVQIAASQWERTTGQWSPAQYVVNRDTLGTLLGWGVRRLGNPVAWLDAQSRMHLFVVATGWGGWAASRIVHLRQVSAGDAVTELRFAPVGVLPLSWLWNTSFLVRNAPLALADGGMVLPVHFELGIKYPVGLRFDPQGAFLGMVRISSRHDALQPTLVARSAQDWLALLRDQRPNGKIGVAHSTDAGEHWSDLPDLALDNPDAAIAAHALAPEAMLLAYNPSTSARSALTLAQSSDGRTWTPVQVLEQGASGDEYSYPSLAWSQGQLWVSYTDHRLRIAWQRLVPTSSGSAP